MCKDGIAMQLKARFVEFFPKTQIVWCEISLIFTTKNETIELWKEHLT
jgi:hypothetical protein